jgi:hypothetical protein
VRYLHQGICFQTMSWKEKGCKLSLTLKLFKGFLTLLLKGFCGFRVKSDVGRLINFSINRVEDELLIADQFIVGHALFHLVCQAQSGESSTYTDYANLSGVRMNLIRHSILHWAVAARTGCICGRHMVYWQSSRGRHVS